MDGSSTPTETVISRDGAYEVVILFSEGRGGWAHQRNGVRAPGYKRTVTAAAAALALAACVLCLGEMFNNTFTHTSDVLVSHCPPPCVPPVFGKADKQALDRLALKSHAVGSSSLAAENSIAMRVVQAAISAAKQGIDAMGISSSTAKRARQEEEAKRDAQEQSNVIPEVERSDTGAGGGQEEEVDESGAAAQGDGDTAVDQPNETAQGGEQKTTVPPPTRSEPTARAHSKFSRGPVRTPWSRAATHRIHYAHRASQPHTPIKPLEQEEKDALTLGDGVYKVRVRDGEVMDLIPNEDPTNQDLKDGDYYVRIDSGGVTDVRPAGEGQEGGGQDMRDGTEDVMEQGHDDAGDEESLLRDDGWVLEDGRGRNERAGGDDDGHDGSSGNSGGADMGGVGGSEAAYELQYGLKHWLNSDKKGTGLLDYAQRHQDSADDELEHHHMSQQQKEQQEWRIWKEVQEEADALKMIHASSDEQQGSAPLTETTEGGTLGAGRRVRDVGPPPIPTDGDDVSIWRAAMDRVAYMLRPKQEVVDFPKDVGAGA